MNRARIDVANMTLPVPPIPMPGERVFWYSDATPFEGSLVGHDKQCRPKILNVFEREVTVDCFEQIRLLDPSSRVGPNWLRLPESAAVYPANGEEIDRFGVILSQRIPPGPKYYELITEIWQRGFEVYLVGGTVRDIIAGDRSFDIDLVTTMPLRIALPLLKSMYRYEPTISGQHGFVRIGGRPRSGDPFVDLKTFCLFQPGTGSAVFGTSFETDVAHRDFACNSVYYDPVNKVIIDPTGRGLSDAKKKELYIVCDPQIRNSYHQAEVVIRFFKFLCRGFTCSEHTRIQVVETFAPCLPALKKSVRVNYMKTQLLSKHPAASHEEILLGFRDCMCSFGLDRYWMELFEPIVPDILS